MTSFKTEFSDIVSSSGKTGWLTSVLQLGGWAGALSAGVLAEVFTRKHTIFGGALWVILGSYLAAGAQTGSYLYAGRFFTGIGVGTLSAVGWAPCSALHLILTDIQERETKTLTGLSTMQNSPRQNFEVF
jgi:MFS family permease